MNEAIVYLIKMVICSGALYAYYLLALRNRIFHQWNRFYLLATVLFSLIFPLIPMPGLFAMQGPQQAVDLSNLFINSGNEITLGANEGGHWSAANWIASVYGCIAAILIGRLLFGLLQIARLFSRSPVQQLGQVSFVSTQHPAAPFSFFNWLFWKKDIELQSPGGQSIFRHELVHIQEHHSVDKMMMQLVLALCWINPVFYLVRRELQLIHEFIADKKAVGNAGVESLAAIILQSAYSTQYNQLINPFFQQPIKRRLAMLQKTLKAPRNAYLGRILSIPLCALLLFAFSKKKTNSNDHLAAPEDAPTVTTIAPAPAVNNSRSNSKGTPKSNGTNKNEAVLKLSTSVITDTIPAKTVADDIKEIHVNKKDKEKTITIIYKNGKKEILTEQQAKERGLLNPPPPPPPVISKMPPPPPPPSIDDRVLVVVDGKEKGTLATTGKLDDLYKPADIESINVLKNKSATEKYGEKGKYGVIEINLKKSGASKQE